MSFKYTVREIAERIGGRVDGDPSVEITGIAGLDDAFPGALVRVEDVRRIDAALTGPASALLVNERTPPADRPLIRVANVRLAFLDCLALFDEETPASGVIHPTAVIEPDVEIGARVDIGPYAVVGRGTRIGEGVRIHAHVVIGDRCAIGRDSVLFPHVTLYPRTVLGERNRIQAGVVLGGDGFGYEWDGSRHRRRPHVGTLRLGDDVEIGSNTTIDRATHGETLIGAGVKIDNQVQIGHNVRTGAHCLIIAQVGIAGSATLGDGVILAGQVGVRDHIRVGDGVIVAGRSGLWGSVAPGAKVMGNPARPHGEELRIQASLSRLPAALKRIQELEARVAELVAAGQAAAPVPEE
jgi:UDP-3-O-[3-hydroxymyristoyl] glucosamine N-acyltransferase